MDKYIFYFKWETKSNYSIINKLTNSSFAIIEANNEWDAYDKLIDEANRRKITLSVKNL